VFVDEREDEGRRTLARVVDRASDRGVPVMVRCCHGDRCDTVVDYAVEIGADTVVLDHWDWTPRDAAPTRGGRRPYRRSRERPAVTLAGRQE